jgi:hypothetical protein
VERGLAGAGLADHVDVLAPVFEPNAEEAPRPAEGRSADEGERVVLKHSRIVLERENRAKATRFAALVLLGPALTGWAGVV